MRFKIFKPAKFQWTGPLLAFVLGVINLFNPKLPDIIIYAWYIITPLALIGTIIALVNHLKFENESKK
jgi:hypothetical protein